MPKGVSPVDIYNRSGLVHFNFSAFNTEMIIRPPLEMTQWHRDILQNLQVEDLDILQYALSNQKTEINVVSDGGVHNYQSNYRVIIAAKSATIATNKNNIYSVDFHESSYRSELYGMLAAVVVFTHLIKENGMSIPRPKQIFFYCDNKLVVKTLKSRLEMRRTVNHHRYPDFAIEQQLVQEFQTLMN
jgi:hypothetical protein